MPAMKPTRSWFTSHQPHVSPNSAEQAGHEQAGNDGSGGIYLQEPAVAVCETYQASMST